MDSPAQLSASRPEFWTSSLERFSMECRLGTGPLPGVRLCRISSCYEHVTWAAAMHRRRPPRPCLRPFNMQKLLLLRYQTHSTSSETTPPTVLGQLSAALPRRQWKGVSCGPGPGTAGCILVTLCLVVTTLDRGRANLSPRHRGVASMTTGSRSGDSGMLEYVVLCGHGGQLGRHHLTRTTGPNFRTRWPGSRVK